MVSHIVIVRINAHDHLGSLAPEKFGLGTFLRRSGTTECVTNVN